MINCVEMSKVKHWRYMLYIKQLSMAVILNDMELCKQLEEEYKTDLDKPDDLLLKEYKMERRIEELEKDFYDGHNN